MGEESKCQRHQSRAPVGPLGGISTIPCIDSLLDALTSVPPGERVKGKCQEVKEWIGNVGGKDKVSGE